MMWYGQRQSARKRRIHNRINNKLMLATAKLKHWTHSPVRSQYEWTHTCSSVGLSWCNILVLFWENTRQRICIHEQRAHAKVTVETMGQEVTFYTFFCSSFRRRQMELINFLFVPPVVKLFRRIKTDKRGSDTLRNVSNLWNPRAALAQRKLVFYRTNLMLWNFMGFRFARDIKSYRHNCSTSCVHTLLVTWQICTVRMSIDVFFSFYF